jgi:hypothetical protein
MPLVPIEMPLKFWYNLRNCFSPIASFKEKVQLNVFETINLKNKSNSLFELLLTWPE